MYKILIIEDNKTTCETLTECLKVEGYDVKYFRREKDILDLVNGKKGMSKAHLYIIDIHMPKLNGFDITKKLYERHKNISVLFISGDDSVETMATAYEELDCVDYLKKPFKSHELVFKVNKFFRLEYPDEVEKERYIFNISKRCTYNTKTKDLVLDDCDLIELTKQEERLLDLLIENAGNYVHSQTIENEIWGECVSSAYVRHLVSRLRKKMPPCGQIKNRIGTGYKLSSSNQRD